MSGLGLEQRGVLRRAGQADRSLGHRVLEVEGRGGRGAVEGGHARSAVQGLRRHGEGRQLSQQGRRGLARGGGHGDRLADGVEADAAARGRGFGGGALGGCDGAARLGASRGGHGAPGAGGGPAVGGGGRARRDHSIGAVVRGRGLGRFPLLDGGGEGCGEWDPGDAQRALGGGGVGSAARPAAGARRLWLLLPLPDTLRAASASGSGGLGAQAGDGIQVEALGALVGVDGHAIQVLRHQLGEVLGRGRGFRDLLHLLLVGRGHGELGGSLGRGRRQVGHAHGRLHHPEGADGRGRRLRGVGGLGRTGGHEFHGQRRLAHLHLREAGLAVPVLVGLANLLEAHIVVVDVVVGALEVALGELGAGVDAVDLVEELHAQILAGVAGGRDPVLLGEDAEQALEGVDGVDGEQGEALAAEDQVTLHQGSVHEVGAGPVVLEGGRGLGLFAEDGERDGPLLAQGMLLGGLLDDLGEHALGLGVDGPHGNELGGLGHDDDGHVDIILGELLGDVVEDGLHGRAGALEVPFEHGIGFRRGGLRLRADEGAGHADGTEGGGGRAEGLGVGRHDAVLLADG